MWYATAAVLIFQLCGGLWLLGLLALLYLEMRFWTNDEPALFNNKNKTKEARWLWRRVGDYATYFTFLLVVCIGTLFWPIIITVGAGFGILCIIRHQKRLSKSVKEIKAAEHTHDAS